MKILLLSLNHAPERTGIGKYQGEMAAWLAARGHQVTVVTAPPYYPEWKVATGYSAWRYRREERDGATVYRVPLYVPQKPSGLKRLVHLMSFAFFAKPLVFWLAVTQKPDVVIMTAPPLMAAPVALFAGWLARARTFMHVQDFEVDAAFHLGLLKKPWLYKLALKLERLALRSFTGVSTISPNMRAKLLEKGVPENKTFLVANWANIDVFDAPPPTDKDASPFSKEPNTVLALYSGNLGRKQGLETIVEAARLLRDHPTLRFVVSGDGAGRAEMIASVEDLANITFLPVQPMDSFVRLMRAADIHLLPQKAKAADLVMPSKLGNIFASGRPVVAGAATGTQVYDAVQGCGLAVPPEDAKAFAAALARLGPPCGRARFKGDHGRSGRCPRQDRMEQRLYLDAARDMDCP